MGDGEVPVNLPYQLSKVFLTERDVQHGVRDLADTIGKRRRPIRLVPIMTAAMFMVTDLMKYMDQSGVYVTPAYAQSYVNNEQTHLTTTIFPFAHRVNTTVIVDTVIDTGRTVAAIAKALGERTATVVSLVVKPDKINDDYFKDLELTILSSNYPKGDPYLVGYGLDDDQQLRALPYIGVKHV
ncbi:MAG: phosphoribosyltransferase family protein [Nitrosopumilus sp.]